MSIATDRKPLRILTELDDVRLRKLRQRHGLPESIDDALDAMFDEADLVDSHDIGPNVVTMLSRVEIYVLPEGPARTLTLCYPADANAQSGQVSVLSPVGLALLGRTVGQVVQCTTPDGRHETLRIERIEYQPEANGEYTV